MSKTKDKAEKMNFSFGTIVGFHGLSGQVKVRPTSNNTEILMPVRQLKINSSKASPELLLELESMRFEKRLFYLKFAGFDDRNSVEHLYGAELFADESDLADLAEEEFWVKDLLGLTVYKENGEEVGEIVDIICGGNDLLEIRRENDPPGKTILVPFVKALVPELDLSKKKVVLKDIPGLLEAQ